MTQPSAPRPREGRSRRRLRRVIALTVVSVLAVIVVAGVLAVTRYLPAIDEARALRSDLESMATRVRAAGLDIDQPTIDRLNNDLATGRARLDRLADLLAADPLIGLARAFPATQPDVQGADALAGAAGDLFDAADQGLELAQRYVDIKTAPAGDPGSTTLSRLVEFMATSRDRALVVQTSLARARLALEKVPDGPGGTLGTARDAIAQRIDTYGPLLDAYVDISERLPAILGWEGPRRYLVLTQNPAELRPTGGYTGSYGIIGFDRGRVTERTFRDVFLLDFPWDFPYIEPPRELTDYLLGPNQPWQFADANWSPDFPTSAQDALRLYANESGDDRLDGVLGITTYTIDEFLELTGPIAVPEYEATIASGETTLKALELTRVARPGENRKAFLSAFADRLFDSLLGLPPERWVDVVDQASTFRNQRLLLAWFRDHDDQELAARGGFDGIVRQDPGDYLYPVDSNVAPASKIHAIATRSLGLEVVIDPDGHARNTLDVTWQNPIDGEAGRPLRELPTLETSRILGMYFRVLAPENSRIESVSGGSVVELTAPAVVGEEAGRAEIGNYLMVPPGTTSLRYVWSSPDVVDPDGSGGSYRLTIQKQPGLLPGPLTLSIRVPDGFQIASAGPDLVVAGNTAQLTTTFIQDLEVEIRYVAATPPP